MRASFVNNISAVEYLLHIKADCDYQNHHGDTMLHIAARQDHVDLLHVMQCSRTYPVDLRTRPSAADERSIQHFRSQQHNGVVICHLRRECLCLCLSNN
jgi:ankyrin repeat protein